MSKGQFFEKYRNVMIDAKSRLDKEDYSSLLDDVESDIEDEREFLESEDDEED